MVGGRLIQNQHIRRVYREFWPELHASSVHRKAAPGTSCSVIPTISCHFWPHYPCSSPFISHQPHSPVANGTFLGKFKIWRQIGDTKAILNHLSLICLLFPCNDFQQSTFSCSIDSNDSDFIPTDLEISSKIFLSPKILLTCSIFSTFIKTITPFSPSTGYLFQYFPPLPVSFFSKNYGSSLFV